MRRIILFLSLCILMCLPFGGLFGCTDGTPENYFRTIKNPSNYKIEYNYYHYYETDIEIPEYVEIRVGNKVAYKTNDPDKINHHSLSKNKEWTIYKNTYKQNRFLGGMSWLARNTYAIRLKLSDLEESDTTYLERDAICYKEYDGRGVVEYIVDKEYDICLYTSYTLNEDGVEKIGYEVTLFEVGEQQLPNNPNLS